MAATAALFLSIALSSPSIFALIHVRRFFVGYALNFCPRTIALRKGEVVYDGPTKALRPQLLAEFYGAESEQLVLPGLGAIPASPRPANGGVPERTAASSFARVPAADAEHARR